MLEDATASAESIEKLELLHNPSSELFVEKLVDPSVQLMPQLVMLLTRLGPATRLELSSTTKAFSAHVVAPESVKSYLTGTACAEKGNNVITASRIIFFIMLALITV